MLEQPTEGAVDVEMHAPFQDVGDGGAGAEDLVARYDDEPEIRYHIDPEPPAPRAQSSLLWNGHDEPDGVGQAAPHSKGPFGALEADGEEERVVCVHEGAEEAQLRANVARGDSLDRGRGWDVR